MGRVSNINWIEIMDKFSKYEGRIIDFCRENNITQHQLYNQRKKLKKNTSSTFHVLKVPKAEAAENLKIVERAVRIEIGNAKIYLPADDKDTLVSLVREIAKLC